ncbi:MAG: SpoIID/LytB domain-containing protein [bacterium]
MRKKLFLTFILTTCLSFLIVLVNFYIISAGDEVYRINEKTISEERLNELLSQGKNEYYRGNLVEAEKIYQYIVDHNTEDLIALKNLYFINKETGDIEQSTMYLRNILELDPDNIYWKYKLGKNLFFKGDIEEASDVLISVYNEYKANINTPENNREENDSQYVNPTNESLNLTEKEFAVLSYYLGLLSHNNGDIDRARKFFHEGINTTSHIVLNYIGLADLYNSDEKYEEALNYYKEALKRDSSLSSLFPTIAELYDKTGDSARAFYYWRRSLASGINRNYAQLRIKEISEKHPEFLEKEEEEKSLARKDIKWANISDYTFDKSDVPGVRVGIVENVNKVSFKAGSNFEIKIADQVIFAGEAKESYSIEYQGDTYKIYHGDELVQSTESKESIRMSIHDNTTTFLLYDISYGQNYFWAGTEDRQYRGELELYPVSNREFHIINIINLEYYLFSVVPAEMPAWWPDEAVKAQTLAARSYALSHLGKHSSEGYDLCDTVHCAAYNGVKSETKKTNQLIIETLGEVAIYNGKPITAVFSSNSGGYSENSEDIWGNNYAYLSGANNMKGNYYSFPLEPYNIEKWLIEEPESFSNISTFSGYNIYRWIKVLDADYFKERYNLEELVEIIPSIRTEGGTIKKVIISGISDGEERNIVVNGDRIRSSLGGLKSNRFTMEKIYTDKKVIKQIVFYGSGWGHHVGMDQAGAAGMAAENFDYKEIISHFYQNISIEKEY